MNILSFFQNISFWIYRILSIILINSYKLIYNTFSGINIPPAIIDSLPLYFLLGFLAIILIIFIYIKIAYPFWSTQPVYHTYDFWVSYYRTPYIIQNSYPSRTLFCKFDRIKTIDYLDLSDIQKKEIVNLIQSYSIPEETAIHMFHLGNLDSYMTGHSEKSLVSLYYEDTFIPLPKTLVNNPLVTDTTLIDIIQKPIGCICSRTVDIWISDKKIVAYYFDFITVNREKLDISRYLIQTHEYNQRRLSLDEAFSIRKGIKDNPNKNQSTDNKDAIQISIFKKESGNSPGIVPLVSYESGMWYILNERIRRLPPHFILVPIHRRNIQLLIDFLEKVRNKYTIFGIPELTNLSELIHTGILKVYIIQKGQEIYSAYFFRDSRTEYEEKGALLILCGSIKNTNSADLFYMGFLRALRDILKNNPIFKIIMIESISNKLIYEKYKSENNEFLGENPSGYYLYNYIYPGQPFQSESCFLVF